MSAKTVATQVAAGSAALAAAAQGAIPYKRGSHSLVERKHTIDGKISVRGIGDRNTSELSHRTYKPQKTYFQVATKPNFTRAHQELHYQFYNLETKLIWKAFDLPELIGILLHDETIKGNDNMYSQEFLDAAEHWLTEARYWRCLGISKPFFNNGTLRAHCWEDNGAQTGTIRVSAAMRHALMDLERAVRRRELGLDPNYLWDKWGPSGFVDGSKSDFLPRFRQNPYLDPDGVDVTELDVAPFNTHEQIRERYWDLIVPNVAAVEGCFLAVGHGPLQLEDLPSQRIRDLYLNLNKGSTVSSKISPDDMRTLIYLSASPDLLDQLGAAESWADVTEAVRGIAEENNIKVDAARMLTNTRHDAERVRRFYEEKCGYLDFMNTSDKEITASVLSYVRSLRGLMYSGEEGNASSSAWARPLAECTSDHEMFTVLGKTAYHAYRLTEDLILDKRRRMWSSRFAGEANEESSLDYLLENFGKRPERQRHASSMGTEFDREQEPIQRTVQRRVLDSDKTSTLADARRTKGRVFNKSRNSAFSMLHEKQMQNTAYGVY
ncbi:Hypothetical protein, putative [Bodo saltans]|uniref:Uncharacterized protein n=1 Tax=Bodo saltans TaxID=75058 RepID=A0A0S4JTY1_BODSA|nr:Hypothetical protein, putative [Bodo saltans]|eukprot:CUG92014.1 Hypothetical protein, putative [Bodo saltans]